MNIIRPPFPTPLERKLLDIPAFPDDEDATVPFESLNPFEPPSKSPPKKTLDGAGASRAQLHSVTPRLIPGALAFAFECLALACAVALAATVLAAVLR